MTEPQPAKSGLGAVLQETEFDLKTAIGGPQGVAEGVVPTLLFLIVYAVTKDITWSAIASGLVLLPFLALRLIRKQPLTQIIAGVFGVAIGAFAAIRSGNDTGFFLPSLLINAVYFAVLFGSVAIKKPLIGYFAGLFDPRVAAWKQHARTRRIYSNATLVMSALFLVRLAIYLPLYFAGQVEAMGVVKLFTGIPAFALTVWIAWRMHVSAVKVLETQEEKAEIA